MPLHLSVSPTVIEVNKRMGAKVTELIAMYKSIFLKFIIQEEKRGYVPPRPMNAHGKVCN
jgi:hypothetical protein